MSKYIGTKAVNLSTTSADVTGNADIDGNLTVGGNLTVSGTTITVDHATAQTVDLGDDDKIRLGADYELQLWSDGTTGQISGDINHTGSITTDGNFGVGINTPTADIHLGGTNPNLVFGTSGNELTYLQRYNDDFYIYNKETAGNILLGTANQERMRVTDGGDVSIGSDHAGFTGWRTLNIRGQSSGGILNFENNDGTRAFAFASQGTIMRYQAQLTGGAHRFETNAKTSGAVIITDSGDVGVGTNSPVNNSNRATLGLQGAWGGQLDIMVGSTVHAQFGSDNFNTGLSARIQSQDGIVFRTNGNTYAAQFDSSGNFLHGKTAQNIGSVGVTIVDGQISSTVDGDSTLRLNRLNSEGNIVQIRQAGDQIGHIFSATNGTLFYGWNDSGDKTVGYGVGDTGIKINDSVDAVYPAFATTGANRDNAIDIGRSTVRFKDLYLSGGVVFGSTSGSVTSKTLDDYEEGTWTPSVSNGTISYLHNRYTKIGRQVTVSAFIYNISDQTTNAAFAINGLPFTTSASSRTTGSVMIRYSNNTSITASYTTANTTAVEFYGVHSASWDVLQYSDFNSSSAEIYFTISYTV